jgi:hypothetical protein
MGLFCVDIMFFPPAISFVSHTKPPFSSYLNRNLQISGNAAPTVSPLTTGGPDRTTTNVVCQTVPSAATQNLDISLQYIVETDTTEAAIPQDVLSNVIPSLFAQEAITSVAGSMCPVQTAGIGTDDGGINLRGGSSASASADPPMANPGGRLLAMLSSNCIISVSSGAPGKRLSSCTPSLAKSQSCDVFEDTFSILHTGNCTDKEIVYESVLAIGNDIASSSFLASVNQQTKASGVAVTLIELNKGSNGQAVVSALTTSYAKSATGMNVAGKAVLACLALVAVFVTGALYVRHRNRSMDSSDDKSVHTQWSNKTDDNSYVKPDWHDLLYRHSKMDVHKCKSVLCDVCQPNLGLVHTVRVPLGANVQSLRLDKAADTTMNHDIGTAADSPSKSSSSRRSLEPLGDLEPITQEHAVPSSAKAGDGDKSKPSWFSFGKGRKENATSDEVDQDMICREVSIPNHSLFDDDEDVISYVASSTQSVQSVYLEDAKEVTL